MARPALLQVEDLRVEIAGPDGPISILDGVDLSLAAGESLGVVGESGCGKSMMALAIMGLLPRGARASGHVVFEGRDLLDAGDKELCRLRGRRLAMIFQEPMTALNPVKSIGFQVAEGLRLHVGLGRASALEKASHLLDRVGLPPARFPLALFPHQLSGGQRQRVMIAMALICEPALLIADEPTTALDVTIQQQILDLVMDLAEERGMALLLISHDLGVVGETTDRILVMYSGRIVECGATERLFRRMAHPYTRGLFSAVPRLARGGEASGGETSDDEDLRLPVIPGEVPDPAARPAGCAFAPRCPRVATRCRQQPPALMPASSGDGVACFHPYEEAFG
jgi:peptide/nickel transport system ATP-binding protein